MTPATEPQAGTLPVLYAGDRISAESAAIWESELLDYATGASVNQRLILVISTTGGNHAATQRSIGAIEGCQQLGFRIHAHILNTESGGADIALRADTRSAGREAKLTVHATGVKLAIRFHLELLRIGYLRESNGEWKFYNLPTFLRETAAAPVQRVTPEMRRQWQEDYRRQQQVLKVRNAAEQFSRDTEDKYRREHESKLAQIHLESELIAVQRAQVERAVTDAERAPADESRAQAEDANVRAEADKAAADARDRELSIVQTSPEGGMNRTSQVMSAIQTGIIHG